MPATKQLQFSPLESPALQLAIRKYLRRRNVGRIHLNIELIKFIAFDDDKSHSFSGDSFIFSTPCIFHLKMQSMSISENTLPRSFTIPSRYERYYAQIFPEISNFSALKKSFGVFFGFSKIVIRKI